jgi:hypothetical protein
MFSASLYCTHEHKTTFYIPYACWFMIWNTLVSYDSVKKKILFAIVIT